MEPLRYKDFELRIAREGDGYVARVLQHTGGEAWHRFAPPFQPHEAENLVLRIAAGLRSGMRSAGASALQAPREFGGRLFDAVFGGNVGAFYRMTVQEANREPHTGVRIKLRLQDAPDLAELPWEFLFDTVYRQFIARSVHTSLVRYVEIPEPVSALNTALPINLLVMISSPSEYPRLDVEGEQARLARALSPLTSAGLVRLEWLTAPTLPALQRRLRGGTFHVFHFIGHGGFDESLHQGHLVLQSADGRAWAASADPIASILRDHRSLRLVVLNACEGARQSRRDALGSVAAHLVLGRIPAVVAMQFAITDEAAIDFAEEFYTVLAHGLPVDAAVAEARKMILGRPNEVEWATPVLYMRSQDGMLFDIAGSAPIPAAVSPSAVDDPRRAAAPAAAAAASAGPAGVGGGSAATTPSADPAGTEPDRTRRRPAPDKKAPQRQTKTIAPTASMTFAGDSLELEGHVGSVMSVVFSPDGSLLASCSLDNTIRIWSVRDGTLVKKWTAHNTGVRALACSPDGKVLVSAQKSLAGLTAWRIPDGRRLRDLSGHGDEINAITFSPEGHLVSASDDKTIRVWRVADGSEVRKIQGHTEWIRSLAVSPDGATLASGTQVIISEAAVRLWNARTGELLQTMKEGIDQVWSLAFSPDGRLLASGSAEVRIWQVPDGKLLFKKVGHKGAVNQVAFSPDGALLASASEDQTVRLCDAATGRLLRKLRGHSAAVNSVAFSPDGRLLASGSADCAVRLWPLPPLLEKHAE